VNAVEYHNYFSMVSTERTRKGEIMARIPKQVADFLDNHTLAVAGVSRDTRQPANTIYRKLKSIGYETFAVNPNAIMVEGDTCYANLRSIPAKIGGVVIVTSPTVSIQIVRECGELGIRHVWFHRSFGSGSVSAEAVQECERLGIQCLAGGCPMMYCAPVDFGHQCIKWVLALQNRLP
jgi:predicted CoA-binding protein